jgi:hypothetical protein
MKQLLKQILLLVLALGITMFFVEKKFSKYQTSVDTIMKKIDENASKDHIYYIGNSHAGSLGSKFLNDTAINISFAGINPYQMKEIITYLLSKSKGNNTIIANIDYDFPTKLSLGEATDLQFYRYNNTVPDESFSTKIMAMSNYYRSGQDYKYFFSTPKEVKDINFVPLKFDANLNDKDCLLRAMELGQATCGKKDIIKNTKNIAEIFEMVKNSNSKLYVITVPKRICLMQNYMKYKYVSEGKLIVDSLIQSTKTKYVDYSSNTKFTEDDFYDYDHLNAQGALKIQELLAAEISVKP